MKRTSIILTVVWLTTCLPDDRCDPGQRHELGSCLPKPQPDAGGPQEEDAGEADAATACAPGSYEGFGVSCESDADCTGCAAPTCATAPINLCSRIQCQDDPKLCPPDWSCTDISAFSGNPNVTHICLKL
jgi:hypothetical protein